MVISTLNRVITIVALLIRVWGLGFHLTSKYP